MNDLILHIIHIFIHCLYGFSKRLVSLTITQTWELLKHHQTQVWLGVTQAGPGTDPEVEASIVSLLEALTGRHHPLQQGAVHGEGGQRRQEPAVTWARSKVNVSGWQRHWSKLFEVSESGSPNGTRSVLAHLLAAGGMSFPGRFHHSA